MALGMHGSHANLWNGVEAEGDDASSDAFDTKMGNEAHIFGRAEGAYMMRVQYSQDGKSWYSGERVEPDDDGNFNLKLSGVQARYVRLQALRGPDFAAYEGDDNETKREPMRLTATLVAKTTR
jgi:hypothetical protein